MNDVVNEVRVKTVLQLTCADKTFIHIFIEKMRRPCVRTESFAVAISWPASPRNVLANAGTITQQLKRAVRVGTVESPFRKSKQPTAYFLSHPSLSQRKNLQNVITGSTWLHF